MTDPPATAKSTLVTIIAASELWDRLETVLRNVGVNGYTFARVSGRGEHGRREGGLLELGNVRIETLVSDELAHSLLQHLVGEYSDRELIAYMQEVTALVR